MQALGEGRQYACRSPGSRPDHQRQAGIPLCQGVNASRAARMTSPRCRLFSGCCNTCDQARPAAKRVGWGSLSGQGFNRGRFFATLPPVSAAQTFAPSCVASVSTIGLERFDHDFAQDLERCVACLSSKGPLAGALAGSVIPRNRSLRSCATRSSRLNRFPRGRTAQAEYSQDAYT